MVVKTGGMKEYRLERLILNSMSVMNMLDLGSHVQGWGFQVCISVTLNLYASWRKWNPVVFCSWECHFDA
jgi:hypothetical protein